jgi:5'(3')-deoxyribonucleotidase
MEESRLKVFFCSTPFATRPPWAYDKLPSIEEHLRSRRVNHFILTHDKTLVRGDLLIDDTTVQTIEGLEFRGEFEHAEAPVTDTDTGLMFQTGTRTLAQPAG